MKQGGMKKGIGLALVLTIVLVFAGLIAWGEPVTVGGAEDVADAFIGYEQAKSEIYRAALGLPADARVDEVNILTDGASPDTLAYVFELKPSGYIVVTADTQIVPIVAYSFTGTFSWEESVENVLLDMLRQDMTNRLRAVQDGQIGVEVAADNERQWEEYRGTRVPDRATYEVGVYGPWTLDPWSQGSPYWDDCPMDPNDPPVETHRCVVGCVATALAQILNYWQYPTSVTFLASDNYTSMYDPGDGNGTRTIPITATTATFSGLNYNNCSPSDAAKADLSFAAGVSVRMDYSSAGSAATTAKVAPALAGSGYPWSGPPPQRWGYHSADVRTYNSAYSYLGSPYYVTQTTFFNELKSNMMQARPAQMAIAKSTGGGHSIVVDGYHPTNEDYHLNYGWGTSNYGWYSLPSDFPSGYDILRYAVYNIVPTTSTYTMSTSTSGTGTGTVQALPGTGALTTGTHVLVSATPAPGSSFSYWTGDLSGSANPALVILDGNKSVNAVFSGGGDPVSSKKWTIMVYLAADNTLGGGTPSDPDFMDIDEMETALITSNAAVNVVVLWDKPGTNDTYIYWVQPDSTEGSLATYTLGVNKWTAPGGPEENMGDQSTLTNFLDWVFYYFDSDYYGLILWNHGAGWAPKLETFDEPIGVPPAFVSIDGELSDAQLPWSGSVQPLLDVEKPSIEGVSSPDRQEPSETGICWDETDSNYLTTKEAAYGIENSTRGHVENLGLDACLMQMLEVAYEFYNTPTVAANYLTASEASEWGYGWAYHQILSTITTSTTPAQLAVLWGSTRSSRHASGGLDTISSIDLWQVGNLAADVSALANRLTTLLGTWTEYERIMYAKLYAEWFPYTDTSYMDLGDFCNYLDIFLSDTTARSLAQAVITRLSSVVISMANSSSFGSATGISIYLPHYHDIVWANSLGGPSLANYTGTNLAFCANGTWDEFINAWLATDYVDPYEPNDNPATAYDLGTASGSQQAVRYLYLEADFDDGTEDWYRITIPFSFDLDAWVWCTEYNSDTVIYAYDSLANAQAGTFFAQDDDGMMGLGYNSLGSRIYATDGSPGTYYMKVVPYGGSYATEEDYEIWVTVYRRDTPAVFRVESSGNVLADGPFYGAGFHSGSADIAEWVPVSEPVEPGDVLELDPNHPGHYRKSRGPCSYLVAGVVSTEPGVVLGSPITYSPPTTHAQTLLALVGIVPVKVTNEGGPIQPGDLLVCSSIPGYAMKWNPQSGEVCGLIGKALEPLDSGTGVIRVLLTAH